MKKGAASKGKSSSRSKVSVSKSRANSPKMSKNGWELPVFVISIVVVALAAIMVSKAPIYGPSGNVISGGAITGPAFQNYQDCLSQTSGMGSQSVSYCQGLFPNVAGSTTAAGSTGAVAQSATWGSIFGVVSKSGALVNAFQYLFGKPVSISGTSAFSGAIITIALWLILFLTFADIIATFSTFSKWVSWVVGFLIAVVAANVGFVTGIAAWAVNIFAVLGTFAVWAGLVASLVAFVAVNLGLTFAHRWVLKRRAMMVAATSEAGGEKLKGALEGLGAIGDELEKIGK